MISHRDIGQEVNLSADEILRLVAYLNSNKLLKDCLELATMSPKTKSEILDSLFLPPA